MSYLLLRPLSNPAADSKEVPRRFKLLSGSDVAVGARASSRLTIIVVAVLGSTVLIRVTVLLGASSGFYTERSLQEIWALRLLFATFSQAPVSPSMLLYLALNTTSEAPSRRPS